MYFAALALDILRLGICDPRMFNILFFLYERGVPTNFHFGRYTEDDGAINTIGGTCYAARSTPET